LPIYGQREEFVGGEMSDPKIERIKEGTPEWTSLRQNYFDGLIERFYLTGDIEALQKFIIEGGDIHKYDSDLAETVAGLIGAKPEPNPGGAKDAEMINFYLEVELRRIAPALKNKNKHLPKDLPLKDQLAELKSKTSISDAIQQIAERYSLSFDGGDYRYKKGKKLFKERFKKGWK